MSFSINYYIKAINNAKNITTPAPGTAPANIPVGSIVPWSSKSTPCKDFLPCDGRAVSRQQYPDLFMAIEDHYGSQVFNEIIVYRWSTFEEFKKTYKIFRRDVIKVSGTISFNLPEIPKI